MSFLGVVSLVPRGVGMFRGIGMYGDGCVGMSRGWVPNPQTSDLKEGAGYPPRDMEPGIPGDTVGKRNAFLFNIKLSSP